MNGLLAVICYEHVFEQNTVEMWILEDYGNQVWTMESITFPSRWESLACPVPYGTIYTGEILFATMSTKYVPILFYDMKENNFRRVEITSLPERLPTNAITTRCVKRVYTESMLSLRRNYE